MNKTKCLFCIGGFLFCSSVFADGVSSAIGTNDGANKQNSNQLNVMMIQRFNESDTNHDGYLSRAEAVNMPMVAQYFDQIDTNGDGQISRSELQAAFKQQMQ